MVVDRVTVRHSEGPPLRRSCPPFRSEAIGGRKSIGRIPRVRVRVRVRVRLDQPAIQAIGRIPRVRVRVRVRVRLDQPAIQVSS